MSRVILLLTLLALLLTLGACGEPSYEDVRDRERDIYSYEADVEDLIDYGCRSEDEIADLMDEWMGLWDEYGEYDDLSNSEKMSFLGDFENILEDLEDAADDLC